MANQKWRGIVGELWIGATLAKVATLNDVTLTVDMGDVDVSDHDSGGWASRMTTFAQWSASGKAFYLGDSATGVQDTGQAAIADAGPLGTQLLVELRPIGTGTGKAKWSGTCFVKKWSTAQPASGAQAFDFDLVGVGALVRGTQT